MLTERSGAQWRPDQLGGHGCGLFPQVLWQLYATYGVSGDWTWMTSARQAIAGVPVPWQ